jgi:diaminopimelate epimerase
MRIPFTKAHGAKNDFLLTWASQAPRDHLPEVARAICDRHTGIGADGWLLVKSTDRPLEYHGAIRLFNSDGSEAEISGNGTRCAAAFLIDAGLAQGDEVRVCTGAGIKRLRVIERNDLRYLFEMNMGRPEFSEDQVRFELPLSGGPRQVTIVSVGNPQCAVFVDGFNFDWRKTGAEIESHPFFPDRTNVSFVRRMDDHTLDVRFYERGAGETLSSGTGSTGAAVAAILRGVAASPVKVLTPAGPLDLRWDEDVYLTGPAEIVAGGEFYF